jgi:hypothetical protein
MGRGFGKEDTIHKILKLCPFVSKQPDMKATHVENFWMRYKIKISFSGI